MVGPLHVVVLLPEVSKRTSVNSLSALTDLRWKNSNGVQNDMRSYLGDANWWQVHLLRFQVWNQSKV